MHGRFRTLLFVPRMNLTILNLRLAGREVSFHLS
jgi:hypothetical protein